MKKFLAILLCLSMLLCITPVIAAAEGETAESTPTGTAITTLAELRGITGDGDYYLANDIYVDLSTVTLPLIPNSFTGTLDGKDRSILFKDETTKEATNEITHGSSGGVLFTEYRGNCIKNLTVGSADAPANVTLTRNGGTNFGIIAQKVTNANSTRPVFENITVYANISQSRANQALNTGLFFGESVNNTYLINCKAVGSIKVNTGAANAGGFVGIYRPVTTAQLFLRFVNCISDVTFSKYSDSTTVNASSSFGGLVGAMKLGSNDTKHDNLAAYNCIVVNELPGYTENETITWGANAGDASQSIISNCAFLSNLADGLALTTDTAASFRFNAPTGIRFRTTVSGLYDTLVALYGKDNVKLGTIVAPKLFVDDAEGFTKEALDALTGIEGAKYVDCAYGGEWYGEPTTSNIWNAANPVMMTSEYTYVGSIANIDADYYDTLHCAIGYISYRADAESDWTTVYATYGENVTEAPAHSIRNLADAAYAAEQATPGTYTTEELAAIEKYRTK